MTDNFQKVAAGVRKIVRKSAYSKHNFFTETAWEYHVLPVVYHSLALGKIMKADLKVLELSALLHDYASFIDKKFYREHHKHSARLAKNILDRYSVPQNIIEHIQECILSHRGSVRKKKKTIEAKILASADAMSHITEPADMFYLTYGVHQYKTKEGAVWLKGKIERSWKKIMPIGKRMVKKDYELISGIVDRIIKKG